MNNDPIIVTLSDGRVIAIMHYTYTPGHHGTQLDPPDGPAVEVHDARWITPPECSLGVQELWTLHDDGPDYDAILLAVQEREEAKLAAEIGDSDEDGDWSLTDVLAARGYTHHAVGEPGSGVRSVCRDGAEVFKGRAGECWAWLETQEREAIRADLTASLDRLLRARAGDVLRLNMIDGGARYGAEHYVVAARPCEFVSDPERGIEMDVLPLVHGGHLEFVTVTATGEAWLRLRGRSGDLCRCNVWSGPFREVAP